MANVLKKFYITPELRREIEQDLNENLIDLTTNEDMATFIIENYTDIEDEDAFFANEIEIWYHEDTDEDQEREVTPAWTEEYLNTLGMSKKDF